MTQLRYSNTGWSVATPGVTPPNVPDLVLWLDADDPNSFTYSSGVIVSQWNDKSGNANHMSQATVAIQPSRSGVINSRPSVVFASDLMSAVTAAATWAFMHDGTGYTVFIVGTVENSGAAFPAFAGTTSGWTSGPGFDILVQRANASIRHAVTSFGADNTVVNNDSGAAAVQFATPLLLTLLCDADAAVAADRSRFTFDGITYANNAQVGAPIPNPPASPLAIAARRDVDGGTRLSGQIAEFIVYDRVLSSAEVAGITEYLAAKWAV